MADVRVLADTPHLETPLPRFVLTLTCPFSGAGPPTRHICFSVSIKLIFVGCVVGMLFEWC